MRAGRDSINQVESWLKSERDSDIEADDDPPLEGEELWIAVVDICRRWATVFPGSPPAQHDAAIWRVIGFPLFARFELDSNLLPLEMKLAILDGLEQVSVAIPELHPNNEPMENGYFMIWHAMAKHANEDPQRARCFEILSRLSGHQDFRVQAMALHGFGHLAHPDRTAIVQAYIDRQDDLTSDERIWLEQCRDGTVM